MAFSEIVRGRLADRGLDAERVLRTDGSRPFRIGDLYAMLSMVAATEKAGQSPTHALARLALHSGLPSEVADSLFLAYNQQSAEEAGHGDKVFGAAYFAMGGMPPDPRDSAVGSGPSEYLRPGEDPKANKKVLGTVAASLGGIEVGALSEIFPTLLGVCERWDHPIARDLGRQITEIVRPEESRHVLIWRYVFHTMIASKGAAVVDAFLQATNAGRAQLGFAWLDRESFKRMLGTQAPTLRQLLGKDRLLLV